MTRVLRHGSESVPMPEHRRGTPIERQRSRLYWPLLLPALLLYLVFLIGPSIAGIWISFNSWRGSGDEMQWVGAGHYRRMLDDPIFLQAFRNTLTITIVCGIAVFIIAFAMTIVLREMWGRHILRSLLFLPFIVSPIVISIGLGLLLAPQGAFNEGLRQLGLDALTRPWLGPEFLFRVILVGIVWSTTGFYVVVLLAGIDRIPRYYYEDCELAGATGWQKFRYVTLPLNWDVTAVAAVLWVINSIRIFEFIIAFGTLNEPATAAIQNIPLYQYFQTTGGRIPSYNLGYGAAMGVVMVVLVALLVIVIRRLMRREAVQY
jgi:raffinose/stachyose/melibiose transport system permease protein